MYWLKMNLLINFELSLFVNKHVSPDMEKAHAIACMTQQSD